MTRFSMNRRKLLRAASLAPLLTLPALPVAALTGTDGRPNPSHFRFGLGRARLTVVSDGSLQLPVAGLSANTSEEDILAFLTSHHLPTEQNYSHTNHIVIEIDDAIILVDIGSGNRFLPTAGKLMENLTLAGIDPASITHVAFTHAHPDHIWGLRDDFDEPVLFDAEHIIGAAEHDYWLQDGLVNSVAESMQQFVVGAVNSLTADGLEWTLADDGDEVAPGLRMIATPGHTPGHMSLMLEADGQQLMILGDAMTHAYVSVERPDWHGGFDADGPQAAATRNRLLDMAATDGIAVLGYHFPFPGVGHIMRASDGYRFIPTIWTWE